MKTAIATFLAACLLAPTGDAERVDFQVLSNFDYSEGMTLPKSVTKYDKKSVSVTGFMATEDGTDGDVECFILVNDACGCEGTPKLNEMIFCAMPENQTTKIHPGNVTVTGTLYIEEEKEDGVVISLYTLDVDSVK